MRIFVLISLLFYLSIANAQQPQVARYSSKSKLSFYSDTTKRKPSHTIRPSFLWGSNFYSNVWLDSILFEFEANKLYDIQFIVLKKTPNWIKLQTAPNKQFWVKSDSPLIIRSFTIFIKEIKRVELVDKSLSSNINLTDTIKTKDFRCFEPIKIVGNKMYIKSTKNFICENENNFNQIKGWVIWNDPTNKFVNLRSY